MNNANDFSVLEIFLDDHGVQAVLAMIAKDCHARAETSRSHPYQSAQWARRATAIARLAASFDGDD
jgi:hypothetical protein